MVPTVGKELIEIGDTAFTSVSELRDAAPVAPFESYVMTATHFAYKVMSPEDW
jgi:hypothetical protein